MLNHPSTTIFAVASTCGSDTCNSVTSTAAQRSLQVQCETSNATGSGNIGNVCSSNDTGQLCRQNQVLIYYRSLSDRRSVRFLFFFPIDQ